jgi:hypothetical protein
MSALITNIIVVAFVAKVGSVFVVDFSTLAHFGRGFGPVVRQTTK